MAKEAFPEFMKLIAKQAMVALLPEEQEIPERLKQFKLVILHDGSSLTVHPELASTYKGKFTNNAPAAIECHLSMSLFERKIIRMDIDADSVSEHDYLPATHTLRSSLFCRTSTPSNCILWFQWFVKRSDARQTCAGVATLRQSSLTMTDGRFTSHPLGSRQNDDFCVTAARHTPVCLYHCALNSSL